MLLPFTLSFHTQYKIFFLGGEGGLRNPGRLRISMKTKDAPPFYIFFVLVHASETQCSKIN